MVVASSVTAVVGSPGRKGNGANLGAVREAGTFELLGKETAVKDAEPFEDDAAVKDAPGEEFMAILNK